MVMMLSVDLCSRLMLGWAECAAIALDNKGPFTAGCVFSKSSSLIVQWKLKRDRILSKLLLCALPAK